MYVPLQPKQKMPRIDARQTRFGGGGVTWEVEAQPEEWGSADPCQVAAGRPPHAGHAAAGFPAGFLCEKRHTPGYLMSMCLFLKDPGQHTHTHIHTWKLHVAIDDLTVSDWHCPQYLKSKVKPAITCIFYIGHLVAPETSGGHLIPSVIADISLYPWWNHSLEGSIFVISSVGC